MASRLLSELPRASGGRRLWHLLMPQPWAGGRWQEAGWAHGCGMWVSAFIYLSIYGVHVNTAAHERAGARRSLHLGGDRLAVILAGDGVGDRLLEVEAFRLCVRVRLRVMLEVEAFRLRRGSSIACAPA